MGDAMGKSRHTPWLDNFSGQWCATGDLKDVSQKRETSEMNLKKQENCELRFIYLSEQS